MLKADVQVRHRRSLLFRGYSTRIEAAFRAPDGGSGKVPIGPLFTQIVSHAPELLLNLQHAEARDENGTSVHLVQNLRGRPPEMFSGTYADELRKAKSEELFYSSGVLYRPPANLEDYPEDIEELEQVPFSVEVNTSFHSFDEHNHVHHAVRTRQSDVLERSLGDFDLRLIAKLLPAKLHQIRLGLEYYAEQRSSMLSGLLPPSVKTRFFLDILPDSVSLLLEDESGGGRNELPDFERKLVGALDRALDELDLYVGLTENIEARLQR